MPTVNTGRLRYEERDTNPFSPTFNQLRTVVGPFNFIACPQGGIFRSAAISETVYRDDCGNGSSTAATYTVPEGHISDMTSQGDVDARARQYFDETKQAYARQNTTCFFPGNGGGGGGQPPILRTCLYDSRGCWTGVIQLSDGGTADPTTEECAACNQYTTQRPCFTLACQ